MPVKHEIIRKDVQDFYSGYLARKPADSLITHHDGQKGMFAWTETAVVTPINT